MKPIDRHIVEWATTGTPEIPGRIDVRQWVVAKAHTRLLLMIAPKGRPLIAQVSRPSAPSSINSLMRCKRGLINSPGEATNLTRLRLCAGNQVIRLINRCRHALIEVNMKTLPQRP